MLSSFKVGERLTFNSVLTERANLYQALLNQKNETFCLDLSNVLHCDSAGLALVLEARKLCRRANKAFELRSLPAQMLSLAQFSGVREILE